MSDAVVREEGRQQAAATARIARKSGAIAAVFVAAAESSYVADILIVIFSHLNTFCIP